MLKIKDCSDGVRRIFCILRRKFVILTPEELLRQKFVSWMINEKNYPVSLMANEVSINLNGLQRRCDTVVYTSNQTPLMIIEYKASNIKITQKVFDQIAKYNMVLQTSWLVVTNGITNYCCRMYPQKGSYEFVNNFPAYDDIIQTTHQIQVINKRQ